MRKLLVGIAAGFALGWLVFGLPRDQPKPRTVREEARAEPERPPRAAPPQPRPEPVDEPATQTRVKPVPLPDPDKAREEGDWPEFVRALNALGQSKTVKAQAKLIEIMADTSIRFPQMMGGRFHEWLEGCTLPGIAAAARKRFLAELAAGKTSWTATHGWFDLMADHGTEQDLRWLLQRKDSGQIRSRAIETVAASPQEAAVGVVSELFEQERLRGKHIEAFARNHPEAAFSLLDGAMAAGPALEAIRVYGRTVPEAHVDTARRRLLGLTTTNRRLQAVYAVERLEQRGLDITGLESILEEPLEVLTQGDERHLSGALYALEYNKITWNERTLGVLQAASPRLPKYRHQIEKVAKMIAARLDSGWKKR